MLDVVMLVLLVAAFAGAAGYVLLCRDLAGPVLPAERTASPAAPPAAA